MRGTFDFDAPNLLTGLAQHSYLTARIGGVTYFSRETPLASVLPDLFHEDHWRHEFCSPEPDSTSHPSPRRPVSTSSSPETSPAARSRSHPAKRTSS